MPRYRPQAIADGAPAHVVTLVEAARSEGLAIYAGAGLSMADPTALPSGAGVATEVHGRLLNAVSSLPDCDEENLVSVADAADQAGGLDALKRVVVSVVEFTSAEPNYGHRLLAALVLEGVATALTTNWDDCIERGCQPDRLLPIVTAQDLFEIPERTSVLKLHGCATRPMSLLVTTDELRNPDQWVKDEVNSRLARSYVVFLGIGHIADYVQIGLDHAVSAVPDLLTHVRVVFPGADGGWEQSGWASLVDTLPTEHRISATADEFLDQLAVAYIRLAFAEHDYALRDCDEHREALARLVAALEEGSALAALEWIRSTCVPRLPGKSALGSGEANRGFVAVGVLAAGQLVAEPGGVMVGNGQRYQLLISTKLQPVSSVTREAARRLEGFLAQGGDPGHAPIFVVSASLPVGYDLVADGDLVGVRGSDDVIDGPISSIPDIRDAWEVVAS